MAGVVEFAPLAKPLPGDKEQGRNTQRAAPGGQDSVSTDARHRRERSGCSQRQLAWTLHLGSICTGEVRSHLDNYSPKDGALLPSLESPETPREPNEVAKGTGLAASWQGKGCGAKTVPGSAEGP